eukprot:364826-Chlamydomonas_euryale.AAC.2
MAKECCRPGWPSNAAGPGGQEMLPAETMMGLTRGALCSNQAHAAEHRRHARPTNSCKSGRSSVGDGWWSCLRCGGCSAGGRTCATISCRIARGLAGMFRMCGPGGAAAAADAALGEPGRLLLSPPAICRPASSFSAAAAGSSGARLGLACPLAASLPSLGTEPGGCPEELAAHGAGLQGHTSRRGGGLGAKAAQKDAARWLPPQAGAPWCGVAPVRCGRDILVSAIRSHAASPLSSPSASQAPGKCGRDTLVSAIHSHAASPISSPSPSQVCPPSQQRTISRKPRLGGVDVRCETSAWPWLLDPSHVSCE